jgi:hypothetical protein
MKNINIGNILSVCIPDGALCKNHVTEDRIGLAFDDWPSEVFLHLFQDVTDEKAIWCHNTLEDYLRSVIGPPYQTSVQEVDGETWLGYQGVTALSESEFLVNRVIASKLNQYGLRLEFKAFKDQIPESLIEVVEGIVF